jgi:hypothetical protein
VVVGDVCVGGEVEQEWKLSGPVGEWYVSGREVKREVDDGRRTTGASREQGPDESDKFSRCRRPPDTWNWKGEEQELTLGKGRKAKSCAHRSI